MGNAECTARDRSAERDNRPSPFLAGIFSRAFPEVALTRFSAALAEQSGGKWWGANAVEFEGRPEVLIRAGLIEPHMVPQAPKRSAYGYEREQSWSSQLRRGGVLVCHWSVNERIPLSHPLAMFRPSNRSSLQSPEERRAAFVGEIRRSLQTAPLWGGIVDRAEHGFRLSDRDRARIRGAFAALESALDGIVADMQPVPIGNHLRLVSSGDTGAGIETCPPNW